MNKSDEYKKKIEDLKKFLREEFNPGDEIWERHLWPHKDVEGTFLSSVETYLMKSGFELYMFFYPESKMSKNLTKLGMFNSKEYIKLFERTEFPFVEEKLILNKDKRPLTNKDKYNLYTEFTKRRKDIEKFEKEKNIENSYGVLTYFQELNYIHTFMQQLKDEGLLTVTLSKQNDFRPQVHVKKYQVSLKLFLKDEYIKNNIFFAREFSNESTLIFYNKLKEGIEKEVKLNSIDSKTIMIEKDLKAGMLHDRIKDEIKACKYFIADLTSFKILNLEICDECKQKYSANGDMSSIKLCKNCVRASKYFINLNVMWELGYASALNKPILCLINKNIIENNLDPSKLPFDISTHSTIIYSFDENEQENEIKIIIDTIKASLIAG
ncbi:MAG: hypothetical protein KFW07_04150 [Mycoplasmataceae bacterium]|nr:hypothetical protein [Mycoplasmataceae bacterium]